GPSRKKSGAAGPSAAMKRPASTTRVLISFNRSVSHDFPLPFTEPALNASPPFCPSLDRTQPSALASQEAERATQAYSRKPVTLGYEKKHAQPSFSPLRAGRVRQS